MRLPPPSKAQDENADLNSGDEVKDWVPSDAYELAHGFR